MLTTDDDDEGNAYSLSREQMEEVLDNIRKLLDEPRWMSNKEVFGLDYRQARELCLWAGVDL